VSEPARVRNIFDKISSGNLFIGEMEDASPDMITTPMGTATQLQFSGEIWRGG
jgi:hypothetical protein